MNITKKILLLSIALSSCRALSMEQSWFGQFKTVTSGIWKRSITVATKNMTRENIQEHKKEIAIGATALAGIGIFAYVTRRIKNRNIQLQRELEKNAAASFKLLEKQAYNTPSATNLIKENQLLSAAIKNTIKNPDDQALYGRKIGELESEIEYRNSQNILKKIESLAKERSQLHQKSSFSLFLSSITSLFSK